MPWAGLTYISLVALVGMLIVYYTEGEQSQIRAQFLRVDRSGVYVVPP